jgi:hypothetical protein
MADAPSIQVIAPSAPNFSLQLPSVPGLTFFALSSNPASAGGGAAGVSSLSSLTGILNLIGVNNIGISISGANTIYVSGGNAGGSVTQSQLDSLSGWALNASGYLANQITLTGAQLSAVKVSGSSVINVADFTGIGGAMVFSSGNKIFISGGASVGGGVTSVNALAGAVLVAGTGGLTVSTNGQNILISGDYSISGALTQSGIQLINWANSIGTNLSGNLTQTGLTLTANDLNISGNMARTGATLMSNDLNISGNLSLTGATLMSNDLNLSGNLTQTGLQLSAVKVSGSAIINTANFTGIGGDLVIVSGGLIFVSGVGPLVALTGQQAWTFAQSVGVTLSGNETQSGIQLINWANSIGINLSGNLTTTGTLLSAVKVTGSSIINTANFTGLGGTLVFWSGNQIFISGAGGGGGAGVSSLNGLTSAVTILGTGGITASTAGQNILISGDQTITGYVNSVSGALASQIAGGGGTPVKITGSSVLATANFTGVGAASVSVSGSNVYVSGIAPAGATIFVDSVLGNDSTAKIYTDAFPFKTLEAAVAAASSGDKIHVRPGSYSPVSNLAKNGVSWWFDAGAIVTYAPNNPTVALWDLVAASVTFLNVDGMAEFICSATGSASTNFSLLVNAGNADASVTVNLTNVGRFRCHSILDTTGICLVLSYYSTTTLNCSFDVDYITASVNFHSAYTHFKNWKMLYGLVNSSNCTVSGTTYIDNFNDATNDRTRGLVVGDYLKIGLFFNGTLLAHACTIEIGQTNKNVNQLCQVWVMQGPTFIYGDLRTLSFPGQAAPLVIQSPDPVTYRGTIDMFNCDYSFPIDIKTNGATLNLERVFLNQNLTTGSQDVRNSIYGTKIPYGIFCESGVSAAVNFNGLVTTNTINSSGFTGSWPNIISPFIYPTGQRQSFAPSNITPGFNFGSISGDPASPINGDAWYDSVSNLLRARINGATVSLGGGGGGGSNISITGSSALSTGNISGVGGVTVTLTGNQILISGNSPSFANISVSIDAKNQTISTGLKGCFQPGMAMTIYGWNIVAYTSGNVVFDINKASAAGFPSFSSIVGIGNTFPSLQNANKVYSSSVAGWGINLLKDDYLEFVVKGCTGINKLNINITGIRI